VGSNGETTSAGGPALHGPRAGEGRRGQSGLVVLEWLLVVAAVAALAALAVVLVQQVVDDTAEQIGASPARRTAAAVAALEVERQARAATAANPRTATWADWSSHFSARCARLAILYGDVAEEVDAAFAAPTAAGGADPISEAALASATDAAPTGSAPQIRCDIGGPDRSVAADEEHPLPSVESFRLAARAIAEAAATLRPGDTWATWKAHFESLCGDLAPAYAHLAIDVVSAFNRPTDQPDAGAAVTQDLLDTATAASPGGGRPQIKCEASARPGL